MAIPRRLVSWQKKYGPGFVMCSVTSGRVIATAPDYKSLIQKVRKKTKEALAETTVIYLPDVKTVSVFLFPL